MKRIFALFLLLTACVGFKAFAPEGVECGKELELPKVPLDVVLSYAPLEVSDFLKSAGAVQCYDTVMKDMKFPECRGSGWDCARPELMYWRFAKDERMLDVYIANVPDKGVGLDYEIPGKGFRKLIVCEQLSVSKKGLAEAQALLKDLCYSDAAQFTESAEHCTKISSADIHTECAARLSKDVSMCESIKAVSLKNKCISEIAKMLGSVELCARIGDSGEQAMCKLRIEGVKR
jgi:hypothetical protein